MFKLWRQSLLYFCCPIIWFVSIYICSLLVSEWIVFGRLIIRPVASSHLLFSQCLRILLCHLVDILTHLLLHKIFVVGILARKSLLFVFLLAGRVFPLLLLLARLHPHPLFVGFSMGSILFSQKTICFFKPINLGHLVYSFGVVEFSLH